MTSEEFIKILNREGYSYEIEGDKIIVTHQGSVGRNALTSLPHVYLKSLTSLPHDVEFKNGGYAYLGSLTSIPTGVVFKNADDVQMESLIGGWFDDWKGNIEDIDSKRLLNLMISKGMFI